MKRWKKLLAVALVLAIAVMSLPVVNTPAATAKKLTLYAGESCTRMVSGIKKITSVKSSNKKVVKVAKNPDFEERCTVTAVKKGTAKLTIKGLDNNDKTLTATIEVTVKPLDMEVKVVKQLENGRTLISVTNNTNQVFERVYLSYSIVNTDGEIVRQSASKTYITASLPGKTAYHTATTSKDQEIDCAASTVKIVDLGRNPESTYKAATEKQVKVTAREEQRTDEGIFFKIRQKNTLDKIVAGRIYIEIYNEADELIGVEEQGVSVGKKETTDARVPYKLWYLTYPSMDHYRLVAQAYYTK